MKSQATKAITLSGGTAILVLAVGVGVGDLSPNGATTTRSSSIAQEFRPPPLPSDVSLSARLGEVLSSSGGSVEPVGQAHPGDPTSVKSPSPPRTQMVCRPVLKFGQHCYNQLLR